MHRRKPKVAPIPRRRRRVDSQPQPVLSSLPPSSPEASSSVHIFSSPTHDHYDYRLDPNLDFDLRCYQPQEKDIDVFRPDSSPSDPFGFATVEKKLIQTRSRRPKRAVLAPAPQSAPTLERIPSPDPSPSKSSPSPPPRRRPRRDVTSPTLQRLEGRSLNPQQLAHQLTSLLPKRPSESKHAKVNEPRRSKRQRTEPPVPVSPLRTTRRTRTKIVQEDLDDTAQQQRQKRLAYYKQLEDYSIVKENVYVV